MYMYINQIKQENIEEKNYFKNNQKELFKEIETHLYHLDNYINRTPSEFQKEFKFMQSLYIKRQFILQLLKENLIMEDQVLSLQK